MESVVDTGRTRLRVSGRLLAVTAVLVLAGGALAACGGSKAAGSQAPATEGQGQGGAGGGQGSGTGTGQFPGASGTLAEIDGSTLQVQNAQSGQVAVTYTTSTTFTESTKATAAAVKVGDCVSVTGVRTQSSSASSAPTSGAARPTSFPAASVEISTPVNGTCTATGFAGGGGGGGRGFGGGTRPSGSNLPTDRPSGAPSGQAGAGGGRGGFGGGFGDFATGKVTAASASSLTVVTTARGQQASQTDTISLTSSTTYTENASATAKALKVGLCVFATGKAGSTGAVAATRIALSQATANGCTTGFGRRPGATSTTGG